MNKNLVIVFVKNAIAGKTKTRLAKTIGNIAALHVYKALLKVTKDAVQDANADVHIYFSNTIEQQTWTPFFKTTQQGNDLGERMQNAFTDGFTKGYKNIVLIGSDLPDISTFHINQALEALNDTDTVFGPAEDGGYYLVGMSSMYNFIFKNKAWSQPQLLQQTLDELQKQNVSFTHLETLNDIDTFEDLKVSNFYKNNPTLQHEIQQNNA